MIKKYPDIKELYKECSVCMVDFDSDSDVRLTLCFHIFHKECIQKV